MRIDFDEEGRAEPEADQHPGKQPDQIGTRPIARRKRPDRERVAGGADRRHHRRGGERVDHQRQDRHPDHRKAAAEGAAAEGHQQDRAEADNVEQGIGGHACPLWTGRVGRGCERMARKLRCANAMRTALPRLARHVLIGSATAAMLLWPGFSRRSQFDMLAASVAVAAAYEPSLLCLPAAPAMARRLSSIAASCRRRRPAPTVTPLPTPPVYQAAGIGRPLGLCLLSAAEGPEAHRGGRAAAMPQALRHRRGPTGGIIMHSAGQTKPEELKSKADRSGKTYIGPGPQPGGSQDREVVSFDGRVLVLKWVNPEVLAALRQRGLCPLRAASLSRDADLRPSVTANADRCHVPANSSSVPGARSACSGSRRSSPGASCSIRRC